MAVHSLACQVKFARSFKIKHLIPLDGKWFLIIDYVACNFPIKLEKYTNCFIPYKNMLVHPSPQCLVINPVIQLSCPMPKIIYIHLKEPLSIVIYNGYDLQQDCFIFWGTISRFYRREIKNFWFLWVAALLLWLMFSVLAFSLKKDSNSIRWKCSTSSISFPFAGWVSSHI